MKSFLKKAWPSLVHIGSTAIVFLNPAVQGYAVSHPAQGATVMAIWGVLLHLANSPAQSSPASKF